MRAMGFVLAFLSGIAAHAQVALVYEGPAKATKQEAAKEADALNKRCLSAGIKTLKVAAVANGESFHLEVTGKTAQSEEELAKVDLFARIKGQRVELRLGRTLTEAERKAGFGQEKPPDGFTYYRWTDENFLPNQGGSAFLASDTPGIPWSDVSPPKKSGAKLEFELTDAGTKKVYTVKGWTEDAWKADARLMLIFDDLCVEEPVSVVLYEGRSKLRRAKFTWSAEFGAKAEAIFRYPLQHVWTRKTKEK